MYENNLEDYDNTLCKEPLYDFTDYFEMLVYETELLINTGSRMLDCWNIVN